MTDRPAPRLSANDLLDRVLDPGSFDPWDEPIDLDAAAGGDAAYRDVLRNAAERSGVDEAVVSGTGLLRGRRVAVVVGEFGFLGGTIGRATADRLVSAIARATAERLPLLAAPASGGTRMQEGTLAFVQMVRITQAVTTHKQSGLPYFVYLRHPTTGGVFASWGSLGHVTVAEPGALIGFLGPRVYEALYGEEFPEGVQRAENLYERGIVDAVVPIDELADIAERALAIVTEPVLPDETPESVAWSGPQPDEATDTWDSVRRSRDPDRPGVRAWLRLAAADVVPLSGTGHGERDPGLVLALARVGGVACVVLGQDSRAQTRRTALGPGALREARRGMRLAGELRLPLVSVIDTPGAALSREAEEGGLAGEIAYCLAELSDLWVPTVAVLLGQGTGGGALALLPADRVVAARHSWLSPLPPEGASAIVYRDTEHAPELAERQGIGALDLQAGGVVDVVVAELPDAAQEPAAFCLRLGSAIGRQLRELRALDPEQRRHERLDRFTRR